MIGNWIDVALLKKSPEKVAKEAEAMNGIINVLVAGIIIGLISAVLGGITAIVGGTLGGGLNGGLQGAGLGLGAGIIGAIIGGIIAVIATPIISVLALVIGAGIVHIFAKLLGGKGSYGAMVGTIGVIDASIMMTFSLVLTIIQGVLGIFAIGPIAIIVGLVGILLAPIGLIIGLYNLYLSIRGIAAVQSFDMLKAALSIIIPMVILFVIFAILAIIAIVVLGVAAAGLMSSLSGTGLFGGLL